MTLAEVIHKTSGRLEAAGLEDSLWQTKVLVAHVVALQPGQLHLQNNLSFDHTLQEKLSALVEKRISGIPLQHVIGEWDFYGRTFKVDRRALIPRPETELLVEFITTAELPPRPLIMDVGTGSGIIGISLALEIPGSRVTGTDISTAAIELAQENKLLLNAENFSTVNCNLAEEPDKQFDVIVANLPYIPSEEISGLHPEVKDHDPLRALDGGTRGTLLILELIKSAPGKLKSGGLIVLETGYDQEDAVPAFFPEDLWADIRTHKDMAGNHRMVTARRR
ncbi:MAG: peptide chain release factor N(5)-glutamine methyltransferase [Candidatus Sabulitectum sp.]|nr:peptide chain release factor N(5)-glutamine methyltransferase [Candidatus Sabulitectum sp.]